MENHPKWLAFEVYTQPTQVTPSSQDGWKLTTFLIQTTEHHEIWTPTREDRPKKKQGSFKHLVNSVERLYVNIKFEFVFETMDEVSNIMTTTTVMRKGTMETDNVPGQSQQKLQASIKMTIWVLCYTCCNIYRCVRKWQNHRQSRCLKYYKNNSVLLNEL